MPLAFEHLCVHEQLPHSLAPPKGKGPQPKHKAAVFQLGRCGTSFTYYVSLGDCQHNSKRNSMYGCHWRCGDTPKPKGAEASNLPPAPPSKLKAKTSRCMTQKEDLGPER